MYGSGKQDLQGKQEERSYKHYKIVGYEENVVGIQI